MSQSDDIEAFKRIPASRIANWDKYGVDAIEADLTHKSGLGLVGGPPEAREQARLWIRMRRRMEREQTEDAELVLQTLYDATNGGRASFYAPQIRTRFDFIGDDRFWAAVSALADDKAIELQDVPHTTGYGSVTPLGVARVRAKGATGQTYNTVNVTGSSHVNIQQAGAGAHQVQYAQYSEAEVSELRKVLEFVSDRLTELNLESPDKKQVRQQIATAEKELDKATPDRKTVSEIFQSIRKILESATGGVLARLATSEDLWSWAAKTLAAASDPLSGIPIG
jgi:hypothetical protein